jgi:peroxiredoxin
MGISIDSPGVARRTSGQLGLEFPLLSDPPMRIIRQYHMTGPGMNMAQMGYVIIDRQGRIRVRKVDRQFGEHAPDIRAILDHLNTA